MPVKLEKATADYANPERPLEPNFDDRSKRRRVAASTRISFPERLITSQPFFGRKIEVEVPTHYSGVIDFTNGAVGVITTLQVLGATLVAAALVIPAVVARLATDRFGLLVWLSTAIGALCGFVGMYTSYYTNVSSGATIVLTAAALFVVVFAAQGVRARLTGREMRAALLTHRSTPTAFGSARPSVSASTTSASIWMRAATSTSSTSTSSVRCTRARRGIGTNGCECRG